MKTLAGARAGHAAGLVGRVADVVLKEGGPLALVPCETPLNEIHLENMLAPAQVGARIVPPMPAFCNHPRTVDDIVDHLVVRVLGRLGVETPARGRWTGTRPARAERPAGTP
ncbi:hypothetical protein GCM10010236_08310 [Streptomyces eurythermus]|nr:hypothetical protein GCM10010236_08310 [Streptomyces eurythermus]